MSKMPPPTTITQDTLLGGQVKLLQPTQGLRATTDTVFLAAACPIEAEPKAHEHPTRLLDLGCGTGAAGLCVLARAPHIHLTGLDIQPDLIDLAKRNAALNEKQDKAQFICTDIRAFEPETRFERIICNPPYFKAGDHTPSPHALKALASGPQKTADAGLKDWLDVAFNLLASHGVLTLIHRAESLDRILQGMGKRFGATEIFPLWPKAGEAAQRVVVRARPNRRTGLMLHPGIVLHEQTGAYTPQAQHILQTPAAL